MSHPLMASKTVLHSENVDPVGRVFSHRGIITRPNCEKINDDLLEILLYLGCNAS